MDLSIIIINWNSARYLQACLKSLIGGIRDITFEVIVVDNASYDGCKEILDQQFPEVRFVQSEENLGFANGNNLGFLNSTGNTVLFLNPDTEIIGSAINKMYFNLQELSVAGMVGCKILNADGSLQTSCVQPYPTIINQMLETDYLKQMFPQWKLWRMDALLADSIDYHSVEVIPGTCMMIKRNIFAELGGFDKEFFMYTEDIDLCFRLKSIGYKAYYIHDAVIVHYGGKSSESQSKNHFSDIMIHESQLKYFIKHHGQFHALLYRLTTLFISILRLIIIYTFFIISNNNVQRKRFQNILEKWRKILRWSLGMEKWAGELNGKIIKT
jgi:N-acetylglucosaminyl-diphospho-decaprenol L-rhamnosyltransferase